MTQIIGFAGKKQSGKNTCCNFITMLKMIEKNVCEAARLNDNGEIEVSDIFGERVSGQEYFTFKKPKVNTDVVIEQMNSVKIYALADPLKQLCIDFFGLPEANVYGTDKDKSKMTDIRWENMPCKERYSNQKKKGRMTTREVLQHLGTEVFRMIDKNIWVNTLLRKIDEDRPEIALICDVRFDNEIKLLKENGGIILGLKRDKFKSKDKHASEQVNLSLCDKVIDNSSLSIAEQNKEIYFALKKLNCKYLTDLGV
tara:strand:- start:17596 stop:18360 length:765 start_codon:yes stop_codon:yes gene_type:complete